MFPSRLFLVLLLTSAPGLFTPASACSLEPNLGVGLRISYPGSLGVAVAVAEARQSGLLPQAIPNDPSNQARLHRMLSALRQLQSRLDRDGTVDTSASFSIVLVGPGLWSRYYLSSHGAIAQYHTPGPRIGEVVVMTHHSVLQALLEGSLTTDVAADSGLLVFSGDGSALAENVFEATFRESTTSLALVNPVGGQ